MESLGLSQKDTQFRNKWRRRRWQSANPGSPGKIAVKMVCVCVLTVVVARWPGRCRPVHVWVLGAEEGDSARLWAGAGDAHNAGNAASRARHVVGRSRRWRLHVPAHQGPEFRRPCPKYPVWSTGTLVVGMMRETMVVMYTLHGLRFINSRNNSSHL